MKNTEKILQNTIERCREKHIIIPTYKQMRNPELIPQKIKDKLKNIGLWDLNSLNLFRITWKNEPVEFGGGYGDVNFIEIPSELSGVKARIIILIGKFFPTGAHKVGATFGPLVEKLITGNFDPTRQKALWPSTGNYCRGGAYDSYLLGCASIAVLPEGMSRERFEWLKTVGAEIFATPGSESNVKEIYDKVKVLEAERGDEIVTLNQFGEMGNPRWHYAVTGPAMEEVYDQIKTPKSKLAALFLTQGSTGTLGSGEYLKEKHPLMKLCAGEAAQCPTMLYNGYGEHRIEGIGDKHVPWIHNTKNTDLVVAIDDNGVVNTARLFNEPSGQKFLASKGVPESTIAQLDLLGFSSISNLQTAIKMAKYYEMGEQDVIFTIATDSMELYQSRLHEMHAELGEYSDRDAAADYSRWLMGATTDNMLELRYPDRRRVHNLKYFTWVEQQGKTYKEIQDMWYQPDYWTSIQKQTGEIDELIIEFNKEVGLS